MAIIGRIQSSAERAQRMIASLLDFTQARVGAGFVLRYENLDLREFAEQVLEEVRLGHPGRELLFETCGDIQGEWDPDRLAQLITNLVNNALVHGLEDTPVRLNIEGGSGSVVLTVHNEGRPISPDTIPHLFEPMRRGKGTTHSAKAGSIGLGLYIVRQIVLSHGGLLTVDSTAERGTTISVLLPRLRLRPEAGDEPVLSS
jgi:signal transduction histidine kinase